MAESQEKPESSSDDEILHKARERFKLAEEAWQRIYQDALDDLKFLAGEQWPEEIKSAREYEKRPCLTTNRMPQFVNQITNDQRQNRPSIKVSPVDNKADIETAKILGGLIRHIQVNSNADVAFDTAFEGAVGPGFGFWRIITDYVSPMSFDLEAKIKAIPNPFSVLIDPYIKEPDGSDSIFGFIFEDIPAESYKAEYKDSELCSRSDWEIVGNTMPGWVSDNTVRIAEYYSKDFKIITIVQLSTGEVIDKAQLDDIELPEGITILKERKARIPIINHYKINGYEILERSVFPGEYIPIIPDFGKILYIGGEKKIEGIIRHAKDPQKMLNFWVTSETELIALAPKAPWIMAEGQDAGYEEEWANANTRTYSKLTYRQVDVDGRPAPPPIRNSYEPPVQAITNARMQSADDLKATTGIYDATLGARSNEQSGRAIERRNAQSQTSNFHFVDNLTRSIRHTGKILVSIIPEIYDAERAERILGEDGEQEIVVLNQMFKKKNGEAVLYDVSAGKYDVSVETGPSYATKRQEAAATMMEFAKALPQFAAGFADLIVKNMDWPGSSEMAERIKKMIGINDEKEQKPVPPEVQAQMQQMMQELDRLNALANEQAQLLNTKTLELESKERIEFAKLEKDYNLAKMKIDAQEAMMSFKEDLTQIRAHLEKKGLDQSLNQNFNSGAAPMGMAPNEQQPPGFPAPNME